MVITMDKTHKKVIVVDDVNLHLLSINERLKKHYEIFPALSAEILFELLEHFIPDLILLDLNMPEVDGFAALKKLKEDDRLAPIPVIILTGDKDRQKVRKAMLLGAVDYVIKPFEDEKLIECIEHQIGDEKMDISKPVVLAVDDSPTILQEINHILEADYTVYTVPAPEAIEDLLKLVEPDLFLLDFNMPKVTGFDLVPIIRKHPLHTDTPIVFLTAEGTIDHVSAAMHLGACDFLVKPINEVVLCEKIASHLTDYVIRRRIRALEMN